MPTSAPGWPSRHAEHAVHARPRLALLVDEHEWTARALDSALSAEGYATLRAHTADQAVSLCEAAGPDVVFVARRLPGDTRVHGPTAGEPGGLRLCRRLRAAGLVSDATPLVVMTVDAVSGSDVRDALDAGAWDLCTLPTDGRTLLTRCDAWVRAKRFADSVAEGTLADVDTGFYNLRGLFRRAREIAGAARRTDAVAPMACVAIRFEPDPASVGGRRRAGGTPSAPGGGAGPAPELRQVRDACLAIGRASDTFARIGTRELAVLAPGTGEWGAHRLVGRLREAVRDDVALHAVVRVAQHGCGDPDAAEELVLGAVTALAAAG